jgi:hypothetical protein
MGFPFDRTIKAKTLKEFVDKYPNMEVNDFEIRFDKTIADDYNELSDDYVYDEYEVIRIE